MVDTGLAQVRPESESIIFMTAGEGGDSSQCAAAVIVHLSERGQETPGNR